MHRRLASSKASKAGNSQAETAPSVYHMSGDRKSQHTYSTVDIKSADNAPAPPPRSKSSNADDFTVIDNDLYE